MFLSIKYKFLEYKNYQALSRLCNNIIGIVDYGIGNIFSVVNTL